MYVLSAVRVPVLMAAFVSSGELAGKFGPFSAHLLALTVFHTSVVERISFVIGCDILNSVMEG